MTPSTASSFSTSFFTACYRRQRNRGKLVATDPRQGTTRNEIRQGESISRTHRQHTRGKTEHRSKTPQGSPRHPSFPNQILSHHRTNLRQNLGVTHVQADLYKLQKLPFDTSDELGLLQNEIDAIYHPPYMRLNSFSGVPRLTPACIVWYL